MKTNAFNVQLIRSTMTSWIQIRRIMIQGMLVFLAILNNSSTNVNQVYAGKPAPPPPVKYSVTIIPTSVSMWAEDMNNHGELVGAYSDPNVVNTNQGISAFLVSEGRVYDLSEIADPPPGWYFARAHGINDDGSIVGMHCNNVRQRSQASNLMLFAVSPNCSNQGADTRLGKLRCGCACIV